MLNSLMKLDVAESGCERGKDCSTLAHPKLRKYDDVMTSQRQSLGNVIFRQLVKGKNLLSYHPAHSEALRI